MIVNSSFCNQIAKLCVGDKGIQENFKSFEQFLTLAHIINWSLFRIFWKILPFFDPPGSDGKGPMKLPLSVCRQVSMFYVKLECLNGQKLTKLNFSENKFSSRENSPKIPPK